jgi:hypothetical protein
MRKNHRFRIPHVGFSRLVASFVSHRDVVGSHLTHEVAWVADSGGRRGMRVDREQLLKSVAGCRSATTIRVFTGRLTNPPGDPHSRLNSRRDGTAGAGP